MNLHLKILVFLVIQLKASNVLSEDISHRSISCSVASMEELLLDERMAITDLEEYLTELQYKIDIIHSYLELLRQENEKSITDEDAYLSNPINTFSLIHRLRFDWYAWNTFINEKVGFDEIDNLESKISKMPTDTEYLEAVESIDRLQNLHYITANNMSNGLLNGRQYDARFSPIDLFALAQGMYDQSHYQEANEWIEEALRSYKESPLDNILQSSQRDLYAFYAETQLELGNITGAFAAMNKALSLDPFDEKINQRYNEMELVYGYIDASKTEEDSLSADENPNIHCYRGFPSKMSNLHCRLLNEVNGFVRLAPFKMEELSLDPYVMKFYDVISDEEILHIKELSRSKLERAAGLQNDGQNIVGNFRTSKLLWLSDNETAVVSRINERIADMTGFDLKDSESLQVLNYGIAGHYSYHCDFLRSELHSDLDIVEELGDRIATVLFYLSDVIDGGETIFPSIKTIVRPQKGTAILWYNLDHEGNSDSNTCHSACPVIVGSKWVLTKWITEKNQFRARPCLPVKGNPELKKKLGSY